MAFDGPEGVWGEVTIHCLAAAEGFVEAWSRPGRIRASGTAARELPIRTIGDRSAAVVTTDGDELDIQIVWTHGDFLGRFSSRRLSPNALSLVPEFEAVALAVDALLDG